ncbi:MAG: hypothetical protein IJO32_07025 [Bacilli bacterium]|nr:hypothetical protein [Bacilli bacterium]
MSKKRIGGGNINIFYRGETGISVNFDIKENYKFEKIFSNKENLMFERVS